MAEPRGIRNNNPGNLREFGIPWKGKVGSDGAFTTFDTPESGIRAMTKDIYGDFARKGKRTIRAITSEYAPPTENDTSAYINHVATAMGVGADDELDLTNEDQMLKLVRAKITMENGKNPYTDEQLLTGIRAGLTGAALPRPMTAAEAGVSGDDALPPPAFLAADLAPRDPFSLYEQGKMEYAAEQARDANAPGFFEAIGLAAGQDWTTSYLLSTKPEFKPDADFRMSAEFWKELTTGVPKDYWDHFDGATSEAHARWLKDRMTEDLKTEERLASLGYAGVALRLGVSLFDPVNIGTAALSGGASLLATGGKLSRTLKGAAAGAAINTALAAPIVADKPTSTNMDLLYAAGLGGVFGTLGSSLSRGKLSPEEAAILREGRRMMEEGRGNAPAGGSSAGAAQNYATVDPLNMQSSIMATNAEGDMLDSAFGAVRIDSASMLKNSKNPLVSSFGGRLGEDAVGAKDRLEVNPIAATEEAGVLHRRMELRFQQAFESNFKAWAKRTGIGWSERARARVAFGEQTSDFIRNRNPTVTFDPEVAAMGSEVRKLFKSYNELANNPGLLDGTTRRPVRGFGSVPDNENYVPRIWHSEKIAQALERFGGKQVGGLIANAIRAAQPNIDPDLAFKIGEAVIKRQREKRVGIMGYIDPFGSDDLTYLRMELEGYGLTNAEITRVLGPLTPSDDAGAVTRGKQRIDLSEDYRTTLQDAKTGERVDFRLADLFENDATSLFNAYSRTQAGWIAMSRVRVRNAKWRPGDPPEEEWVVDGITNGSEYDALTKRVREVADELGLDPARTEAEVETMDFLYKATVGIPDSWETSKAGQSLRLLRDYNFLRLMGQVGFAQVAEVFVGVSQLGIKATLQGVPGFRAMWRNAKTGNLNDSFAQEVEWITTAGADWLRGKNLLRYDDTGTPLLSSFGTGKGAKALAAIDNLQQRGKRGVAAISGMSAVNTMIQRWGAASIMYHFLNLAAKPSKANMKRMASVGLDDAMLQRVLGQIRTHAQTVPGMTGKKIKTMGLEQWTDQEAAHAFEMAAFRLSRRIVQENDAGMMHRVQANPLMKTLLQFRTFVLGAWTKQFLHNVHMRDPEAFGTFMSASFAAGLTYVAQTHVQSVGREDRQEFLENRLSTEKIGLAAFQRAGWSSIIPTFVDTGMRLTGHDPMFDFRTTGQASDLWFGNPTIGLYNDVAAAFGAVSQTALGDDLSQADARTIARPFAFQNALPFTMLLNASIGDLPRRDVFKD